MLALIPLAVFIVSLLLFRDLFNRQTPRISGWREAFVAAAIAVGAFIALSSEALSLVGALTQPALVIVWLAAFLILLVLVQKRGLIKQGVGWLRERPDLAKVSKTERALLAVTGIFASVLFFVARLAPPNTNDSLSYHLSRVMHWIQNQGLMHYSTAIDRQLWMPPWAEMAVMQLYLFKGDDGLSNLVQWFSMGASLVVVSLIARRMGAGGAGQVFAALFCVTLPMGILQATSTQTDYATAFWLVCLAYFALLAHQRQLAAVEWVLLSLVVALGVLTKGTYYTFALPFLVWLLFSTLRRLGWRETAGRILLGVLVVGVLNAGVWARNLITYGFPLGPRQSISALSNASLNPAILASNLIRNSTLNLGTPYGVVNGPARDWVEMIHQVIGQDLNDPASTLDEYRIKRYLHEDRAGNPVHFLLIPLTILLLWIPHHSKLKPTSSILFGLLVLATFVIFSSLYKWQSTGSRLLLPFFVAWAPLAGVAFERPGLGYARIAAALILIAAGVHPLISNPSRALLPLSPDFASLLSTPRDQLLFANSPEVMPAYQSLAFDIRESGCMDVGLKIDSSDIEYPFWFLLDAPHSGIRIDHLDVPGGSARYLLQDIRSCAIVCSYACDQSQHELPLATVYQGKYYLYMQPSVAEY
jgi:hypothetical protein